MGGFEDRPSETWEVSRLHQVKRGDSQKLGKLPRKVGREQEEKLGKLPRKSEENWKRDQEGSPESQRELVFRLSTLDYTVLE